MNPNHVDRDHAVWRKSSRSASSGACVEVALDTNVVAVRDSKDREGGLLAFDSRQWARFTAAVRGGNYNR